jgi:hypothetical protein
MFAVGGASVCVCVCVCVWGGGGGGGDGGGGGEFGGGGIAGFFRVVECSRIGKSPPPPGPYWEAQNRRDP